MVKRNPMNVKSNKQLVFANAILSKWEKKNYKNKPSNWTISQIKSEHKKIKTLMKKRFKK